MNGESLLHLYGSGCGNRRRLGSVCRNRVLDDAVTAAVRVDIVQGHRVARGVLPGLAGAELIVVVDIANVEATAENAGKIVDGRVGNGEAGQVRIADVSDRDVVGNYLADNIRRAAGYGGSLVHCHRGDRAATRVA